MSRVQKNFEAFNSGIRFYLHHTTLEFTQPIPRLDQQTPPGVFVARECNQRGAIGTQYSARTVWRRLTKQPDDEAA
jgi:hypothetical protein